METPRRGRRAPESSAEFIRPARAFVRPPRAFRVYRRGNHLETTMTASQESINMALFCDFENVALGVRDANYQRFDIKPVLERLLLKGSIVVKKAYCDWERYREFKAIMHEANFELIEIPHRSEERRVGKECRRLRPGAYAKRT